jgi:membrane-bound serine protease (ClpP class)
MKYALLLLGSLLLGVQAPAPPPSQVVLVPIVGEIDFKNMALVRRAVQEIKAAPPSLVVFEIDTPGGRIDHMLTMGEDMMSLSPIPTVAFVRPMGEGGMTGGAWSAGAFLAMSCKKLYMYPGTVIGASAPVNGESGEPMPEKYVSAFREKFRARAEQNGYPPDLAVSMVDKDHEVFEVVIDGQKRYLTVGEMEKLKSEGKTFEWPRTAFNPKGKLLTLTDRQVADIGMGKIAETLGQIYHDAGLSSPRETTLAASWSEHLVGFITSGVVSTILLIVGVLGVWIEFKTPGFGVAGVVGILAFGLLFFGHHLAGLAQAPQILLFVLGVILVIIELVWFPGVAIFAISGVLCALIGLVLSLQGFTLPDTHGAPWQMDVLLSSVGRVLVAFVAAGVGFVSIVRFLPKVPLFGRLVLQTELAGTAPSQEAAAHRDLSGCRGHAVTPLRPSGKIQIDGEIYDVVAEGEFVAQGEPVEVLRSEGIRIVVGRAKR